MSLAILFENIMLRLDVIGWIDLVHGLVRHGRLKRLAWYDTSGYQVERTLRQYAIHAYGRALQAELETDPNGDKRKVYKRWMWVNARQAVWAEYLLLCAGVSLITVIDSRNVHRVMRRTPASSASHARRMPTPWEGGRRSRAASPVEWSFDVFGALFGDGNDSPVTTRRRRKESRRRGR